MYTQCQHCLTMFRISSEQLKVADGKVRCSRCNNVFDALENLIESPVSFINDSVMQENLSLTDTDKKTASSPGSLNREANSDRPSIKPGLASDSEIERSLDALADEHDEQTPTEPLSEESILELDEHSSEFDSQNQYLLEQDDGLATEPEYFAAGTESQMSELLDRDSASLLLDEIDTSERLADVISFNNQDKDSQAEPAPEGESALIADSAAPRESTAIEVEPDIPSHSDDVSISSEKALEQQPALDLLAREHDAPTADKKTQTEAQTLEPEGRFTFEKEHEKSQPSRYRYYWATGTFILLLTLCVQTSWYLRDTLIAHDAGRQVLQGICTLAGCELPIRRDTELIIISNRILTTHPDIDDVLSLKLELVNTAAFLQPFPKLQLTLYNDLGSIIARRTFEPHEYNADQYGSNQMMPRLKAVEVALNLQDPGNEVTGFKFDFL
jgi:predicted Zn finger-like uncharacterized protein